MSQPKKKEADKTPSSRAADIGRRRRTGFIIGAVVIAIILIILGVGYYQSYVTPFQRTILTVDATSIRMDYFIKRTKLAGADPMSMLEVLTTEQIIKLAAPGFGITVSPDDITQELRRIARGESETISESEFKAWYRQMLNESQLSDSENREIIGTILLATGLQEYLAERVPTVDEHVYLHALLIEGYEKAQEVKTRLEKGEAFTDLAREVSLDEQSKEKGGDLGWVARGVLVPRVESIIFGLNPGQVSVPVPTEDVPTEGGRYYLFMVSEKAAARELDEVSLEIVKSRALENWLAEEIQYHEISYNFTSETNAWINWQLSRQ